MLIEQSEAISTNISKIARLKTRSGMVSNPDEYAPVSTDFNEVFGGEHPNVSWHWFIPLKVNFPHWAMDNIMGYDVSAAAITLDCSTPYQEPESGIMERDGSAMTSSPLSAGISLPSLDGEQPVSSGDGSVGKHQLGLVDSDDTDVETGNVHLETGLPSMTSVRRKQMLEQKLLPAKNTTTVNTSDLDSIASGVKKRSAGSFIL